MDCCSDYSQGSIDPDRVPECKEKVWYQHTCIRLWKNNNSCCSNSDCSSYLRTETLFRLFIVFCRYIIGDISIILRNKSKKNALNQGNRKKGRSLRIRF